MSILKEKFYKGSNLYLDVVHILAYITNTYTPRADDDDESRRYCMYSLPARWVVFVQIYRWLYNSESIYRKGGSGRYT